jgi:putative hemolysin
MFSVQEVLSKHYPHISKHPLIFRSLSFVLRHLLHEKEIREFGDTYPHLQGLDFVEQVLEFFKISYSTRDVEKERIPTSGKVVIIANHPIGSLDALALIKLISEIRQDVKVVANDMLMAIKPLNEMLLPVNNMRGNTPSERMQNIEKYLNQESALLIFPAGEVSRLRPNGIRDVRWYGGFLRIAKQTKAPILPIFVDAKNSPLFYGVSVFYKPLATLLLVKEMFKRKQRHLPIRIGEIIPFDSFNQRKISKDHQIKMFKRHLYQVGHDKKGVFTTQTAIALPEDRQVLQQAIKGQCELLGETADGKRICLYKHQCSSPIMREIGRLREVAFRAVGEGSNRRRDIDHYDNDYQHIVLWDKEELEIAGAYRFGDAKYLTEKKGPLGLYSATLFEYGKDMQPYLDRGLELGRSFVQPKYWGKRSLDYLWYGIGAFLRVNPQYRYLFGPVSISDAFPKAAKDLLIAFYTQYFTHPHLQAYPKQPYFLSRAAQSPFKGNDYKKDFNLLKHMLANIGVAIPTLYKQYTETYEPGGVHFLSFNVDPDFNDCVDGLVLADITKLKAKKRERYLGVPSSLNQ